MIDVHFKKLNYLKNYIYLLVLVSLFASCQQASEVLLTAPLSDYMPLHIGKTITYRLDSTVFPKNGSVIEVHKYQVKHTITKETTDNAGKKTFVVTRYINDENASGSWQSNGTYLITVYDKSIDVIDNNLRVTVLQSPLSVNYTWPGNSHLPFAPYNQLFEMGAGNDMNRWDFSYSNFGNETILGKQVSDVWTVKQNDETLNIPPTAQTQYGSKEVSIEKYARGIGLVFKDFQLYEFQKGNADTGNNPYYLGFGITMWMISHN